MSNSWIRITGVSVCFLAVSTAAAGPAADGKEKTPNVTTLRFEATAGPDLLPGPTDGRLFVVLGPTDRIEPRWLIGRTGLDAAPIFAGDLKGFGPGVVGVVDGSSSAFPIAGLSRLPAGDYSVQAVFDWNPDLRSPNAPGNLFSAVRRIHIDPAEGGAIALELTRSVPPEEPPRESAQVKFVRLRSKLLSAFQGRAIDLRAGVILPRDFDREPDRRYPLRVHIGGFGQRYFSIAPMLDRAHPFSAAWNAEDAPRMILLYLDGAGPLGDPYQVNSANHGPYGDALTQELIPLVEERFRGIGKAQARVLDGGSTGGWVALALQVFYPEFFNGCWASCPDAVDFRSFQLVNIYKDDNAYVNASGFERPAARTVDGDIQYTMRHECGMENLMGRGDSWTRSGAQWGSWNATYSPRGDDGLPVPLWDPKTGALDHAVAEHWKKYDLRLILERDWETLGPKLRGKIHVSVGEADDFFLNNAVHRLEDFLSRADPPYEGRIAYGPGKGHCWRAWSERELLDQMGKAAGR